MAQPALAQQASRARLGVNRSARRGVATLIGAGAVISALVVLTILRYQPPPPRPASAAGLEFSAERAAVHIREIFSENVPHTVGTRANERVRQRIEAALKHLQYEPEIQTQFVCSGYGKAVCVAPNNIVARLPGQNGKEAVVLTAHYDSVPAGPGISDNGLAVGAVLEIARILRKSPQPRRSVLFLIDDAEEVGLLGADAFLAGLPTDLQLTAVVNLEARGTTGPSVMFETGPGNLSLLKLYAQSVSRPVTSSLFYTIYEQLPNDTDFTVFRQANVSGFNLAILGDGAHYHSPLDSLERLDLGSLQHHGDNALSLVMALANADWAGPHQQDAAFFDLFAFTTIHLPASWMFPSAVLSVTLVFVSVAVLLLRRRIRLVNLLISLAAWPFSILVAGLLAMGLLSILQFSGIHVSWPERAGLLIASFWALGFAAVTGLGALVSSRCSFRSSWAGVWTWWAGAGLAASVSWPAASYPLVLPSLLAAIILTILALQAGSPSKTSPALVLLPLVFASCLILPLASLLYDAIGVNGAVLFALIVGVLATTLLPLVASAPRWFRVRLPLAVGALALTSAILGVVLYHIGPPQPQGMNLVFHQDADSGTARWLLESDALPYQLEEVARFTEQKVSPFPWSHPYKWAYTAESEGAEMAPPGVSILHDVTVGEQRRLRMLLNAPGTENDVELFIPPDSGVIEVRVRGEVAPLKRTSRWNQGWMVLSCLAMPPEGLEIEIVTDRTRKLDLTLASRSPGLPPHAAAIVDKLPPATVPFQDGHRTLVTCRVSL